MHRKKLISGLLAMAAFAATASAAATPADAEKESDFKFRFVGPTVGNRIAAVAGVAGDPSVYYAGAASGGVWKSTDGGNRWTPVFDEQTAAAIGALAIAPSQQSAPWRLRPHSRTRCGPVAARPGSSATVT